MISICIPTYEMDGMGAKFLARNLDAIAGQTFTDYEIIVSDHSFNYDIQTLCDRHARVKYVRNPKQRGNSSANLNNAIDHATGDLIKIIFQDDFLAGPDSLARMATAIGDHPWLVHAYWHTDLSSIPRNDPTTPHIPDPPQNLLWRPAIGAPTAVMFRQNPERFDENLIWVMDCEFYFRLHQKFGPPVIIPEPLAVQTLWPGQLTYKIPYEVKLSEAAYIRTKHAPAFAP